MKETVRGAAQGQDHQRTSGGVRKFYLWRL